jgi:hypothetical protein
MAYVYIHKRNDNNQIFYVGIGSDTDYKRASDKKSRNRYWNFIVKKVGFKFEIIEDNLSWEDASEREKYWIKIYGRKDLNEGILVNMTDGGDGLNNPSGEIKEKYKKLYSNKTLIERFGEKRAKEIGDKISKSNKGQKRPKQSQSMKGKYVGKLNPMYGKTRSDEFKEYRKKYFTENNPGKNKSENTKRKISESKKGKPSKTKGIPRKKIICPYCGKEGGEGLMYRWHFENCKNK